MDIQSHAMQLNAKHSSGAEEWCCPDCGRRVLIKLRPRFEKSVICAGDERASHSGGLPNPAAHTFAGTDDDSYTSEHAGDDRGNHSEADNAASALRPWVRWARESGLDDVWGIA